MRIAIVGTGVAGLVTAHRLQREHDITVFEADTRVGGHVNTIDVELDGVHHAVDTGFIVYNERNYPGFVALLDELGVRSQPTDMSFAVTDHNSGIEFGGASLDALFAQRSNLARPSYYRFVSDIIRFNRAARAMAAGLAARGRLPGPPTDADVGNDRSLGEFVDDLGLSRQFVDSFLIPFGAAIWSADPNTFLAFPATAYVRFMDNHGLLDLRGRPEWRTITGGSRRYVDELVRPFRDRIHSGAPVDKVVRRGTSVEVLHEGGTSTFDRVVLATHSSQALRILSDADAPERQILGAIEYQRNHATLHTDGNLLPKRPRARASWNYAVGIGGSTGATVTYWMNRLQSIESTQPLLVTLNRRDAIRDDQVLADIEYEHPVFNAAAIAAQRRRHEIQGRRNVYFAGAYWGYGFHEDGVQSGLEVAAAIESTR